MILNAFELKKNKKIKIIDDEFKILIYNTKDLQVLPVIRWTVLFFLARSSRAVLGLTSGKSTTPRLLDCVGSCLRGRK